ncbi:hypothetical protein SCAR479_13827 [Seiridium cardinale]|uniref:Uncharacterized protein n=1 Tax=Seiridium cardinale TaxID=138064 RepID=A0ABR2X6V6_9PEZI
MPFTPSMRQVALALSFITLVVTAQFTEENHSNLQNGRSPSPNGGFMIDYVGGIIERVDAAGPLAASVADPAAAASGTMSAPVPPPGTPPPPPAPPANNNAPPAPPAPPALAAADPLANGTALPPPTAAAPSAIATAPAPAAKVDDRHRRVRYYGRGFRNEIAAATPEPPAVADVNGTFPVPPAKANAQPPAAAPGNATAAALPDPAKAAKASGKSAAAIPPVTVAPSAATPAIKTPAAGKMNARTSMGRALRSHYLQFSRP